MGFRTNYVNVDGSININGVIYQFNIPFEGSTANDNKIFQNLTINVSTFTWNITDGYNAKLTLTTNASLNITNISNGDTGTLLAIQDNIGNRLLELPDNSYKNDNWELSTASDAIDILSFLYDGSDYYWNKGGPYV
jgi:hypothetical protein